MKKKTRDDTRDIARSVMGFSFSHIHRVIHTICPEWPACHPQGGGWQATRPVSRVKWLWRHRQTRRNSNIARLDFSNFLTLTSENTFLAHLSRRLEWAIVIAHRPSSVRPSVVVVVVRRRPSVNFSHFWLLLQNHQMDFDETWQGWSTHGPLQVLLFFGQIRPGADPGWGQNRSRGVPYFKKLLLQTGRLQRQTEWIAMI